MDAYAAGRHRWAVCDQLADRSGGGRVPPDVPQSGLRPHRRLRRAPAADPG